MTPAADGFWTYSLRVYDAPGVEPACLALQDGAGADVNLLLWCCWLAGRGQAPGPALRLAIAGSRRWSDAVTAPLRSVRRALKSPPLPAGAADSGALRRAVLAAELESERHHQAWLETLAADALPDPDRPRALAARNLAAYGEAAGLDADFETLLDAVFAGADLV